MTGFSADGDISWTIKKLCKHSAPRSGQITTSTPRHDFLNVDISQGSAATRLGCGRYLNTTLLQISY